MLSDTFQLVQFCQMFKLLTFVSELLGRPYVCNGRSYVLLLVFFFVSVTLRRYVSELPRPIAAKLSRIIGRMWT